MWARVIEVMLGCWLAISPFIFRHGPEDRVLWVNDLLSATAVIVLALLSFWSPLRLAHLFIFVIGLWLIAFGLWASPYPAPPALQNDIVLGILLMMFAILPNQASLPPRALAKVFIPRLKSVCSAEAQSRARYLIGVNPGAQQNE